METDIKKLLVVEEGRQSYYSNVVRYKNPYGEAEHESKWWFMGWNDACQCHESFAEVMLLRASNTELKEKNQELFGERAEALEEGMFLQQDVFDLKEKIESGMVEISTLLDEAFSYLDNSSFISFSREKMTTYLKKLRLEVKKHSMSKSPEGEEK